LARITGFMEAGETPQDGMIREIKEETTPYAQAWQLGG
jgi:ADP-ribose pyrophosphatase YjhB (NUDIX family)